MTNKQPTREEMDKWFITAASHVKTLFEDNEIPWSEEDEGMFLAIRALIDQPRTEPKVEKSLMKLAEDLGVPFSAAKIIHDEATKDQPRTVTREQVEEWASGISRTTEWEAMKKLRVILVDLGLEVLP